MNVMNTFATTAVVLELLTAWASQSINISNATHRK